MDQDRVVGAGQALAIARCARTVQVPYAAATTSYVPLPPQIQHLAHTALQQVTGPNGAHLLS